MHRGFMRRALDLASQGKGFVSPNPLVGAVIVKDGKIVGEGYHEFFGGPHAEVNAFRNAVEDVRGATMYVTLEPCNHHGKTPPCTEAIISNGIKKVIICLKDPNPLVSGQGMKRLEDAGIEVEVGLLSEEGQRQNEVFLMYMRTKRPFVMMKTAMTLDGKIATRTNASQWITGEASRAFTHELRHEVSGIMVGIGTVLADDPSLTTRRVKGGGKDPLRIIVDSRGRIPLDARVLHLTSEAKTIIATTSEISPEKTEAIRALGAEVWVLPTKDQRVDLQALMGLLGEKGIASILLEGGSELNYSALKAGIVDKVYTFIAPKIIGGVKAKGPVGGYGIEDLSQAIALEKMSVVHFGEDVLIEAMIKKGE